MAETPEDRTRSVEAVRFARREACADVVAELETEVARLRERHALAVEEIRRMGRDWHEDVTRLTQERDAARADAAAARAEVDDLDVQIAACRAEAEEYKTVVKETDGATWANLRTLLKDSELRVKNLTAERDAARAAIQKALSDAEDVQVDAEKIGGPGEHYWNGRVHGLRVAAKALDATGRAPGEGG